MPPVGVVALISPALCQGRVHWGGGDSPGAGPLPWAGCSCVHVGARSCALAAMSLVHGTVPCPESWEGTARGFAALAVTLFLVAGLFLAVELSDISLHGWWWERPPLL